MTKVNNKLVQLMEDNISGSTDILIELHNHLKTERKSLQIFPEIIELAKKQFDAFQNILAYLDELKLYLIKNKNLDLFFTDYDKLLNDSFSIIYHKCKKEWISFTSFITISNSRTVFEIFKRHHKDKSTIKIYICESRPKYEGRIFAKKLSDINIKSTLLTEAALASILPKCDCAVIGADSILKSGDVINKIGSTSLAIHCQHFSKPFYVLASKKKNSNKNRFTQKEMPPGEIWRHHPKNVNIKNYYFEIVPKNLITKIIFD